MEPLNVMSEDSCKTEIETVHNHRERLPEIADRLIDHCEDSTCYTHIDYEPIPSKDQVIDIIERLKMVLFPGYFSKERIDPINLKYTMGQNITTLYDMLSEQIGRSIRHDCIRYQQSCSDCSDQGLQLALQVLEAIPDIRKILATDVKAAYVGDPAAKSYDEIIFSYPGIYAIMVYRVAHLLYTLGVPLLPRIMTEYAHSVTGIDIHPGARIDEQFVIDHGTGVVIGETTVIGKNVRVYQSVTIGALSLPRDAGERLRGQKRHPTIEDEVIIYSGATILGGETVIGARSVIGGNVWLTDSVPPDTTVFMEAPRLIYKSKF